MTKPYRPSLLKRLSDKAWFRSFVCLLASLFIRSLYYSSKLTGRIHWHIAPDAEPYVRREAPCIISFWHGRLIFMPFVPSYKKRIINILISHHRDGLLISDTMKWFGLPTIFGSSSRGSHEALRSILRHTKAGETIAITPDGPRGPYQEVAPGVIWIARMTGLPIVPLTFSSTRRRHLRSWDRFLLPRYFGRIHIYAASPLLIPRDASDDAIERYRLDLESLMRAQTEQADRECDA